MRCGRCAIEADALWKIREILSAQQSGDQKKRERDEKDEVQQHLVQNEHAAHDISAGDAVRGQRRSTDAVARRVLSRISSAWDPSRRARARVLPGPQI